MGGRHPKRMSTAEATERAATADRWITLLDIRIRRLKDHRAVWIEERKRLAPFLPKVKIKPPDLVLKCEDCQAGPFPVGSQLTELLSHTMDRHGRRPTTVERTPVER